ncbi:MAG: leucyl aminopeptidase [Bauldia sp.]|nr:leucyl aminopeptidase [Bauldia sp.]
MSSAPAISFVKPGSPAKGTVVVFAGEGLVLGPQATALGVKALIEKAATLAEFKAKPRTTLDILAPEIAGIDRLVVVGFGKGEKLTGQDWQKLGGAAYGALRRGQDATVLLERPVGEGGVDAAEFALGAMLRAYGFDKYKGARPGRNDEESEAAKKPPAGLTIAVEDSTKAKRAWAARSAIGEGVNLARDLVNEPANVLGTVEYAERVKELEQLGVTVEILVEKDLRKLGMGALLGVAQGSVRPPRVAIMTWSGGKAKDKPVVLIGKGVVFDTGGISIKPAAGMEDMKGDMGGSAAVVGTLAALARRKAKANVVGIIGLVENMPDANAQRPGDIVTSMSGQTIEVLNTDAEGRLVLADLIHYSQQRWSPRLMIDLATLTGAIIVALGHHYAGLFSNDDPLATALIAAGEASGDRLWRMPLGSEYDKAIDSKNADMKNIGGRDGGSITAAQFLKRFVKDTPWAHLDIAGTAMGSPANDTNRSWGSGFGVRLLDRLIADNYEG